MEEQSKNSYSHILKYTSIFGGVQGLIILVGLVRNKVMAHLLGAAGIGFNALLLSTQNFASQCTNLGLSLGAVPRLSEYFEQGDRQKIAYYIQVIRLWSLITATLGLLFCMAVSPLISDLTFSWGNHTLHYFMLGFSVAALAITGGEAVILKATRRLGMLVRVQVYTALASLVISLPIYYFFNQSGVLPSIILMSGFTMFATLAYSYRCYPLSLEFDRSMLGNGLSMVKVGLAYILAGAVSSATEMAIRAFLNKEGGLGDVGLYNTAFMITITYAGMVFSSMETDYFPRLSGVCSDVKATNELVNKQMEVSLLLLSPMLVALTIALPVLIPILFTIEFLPVVATAQVAVLAMYFKVMSLPVAYITLARSNSVVFFLIEASYDAALLLAIVVGYRQWGIYGTGIAIVVAHVFEYLIVTLFARKQYKYRSTWGLARHVAVQMTLGVMAFAVTLFCDGWLYWTAGALLAAASAAYSLNVLRSKAHLWEKLSKRWFG